METKLTFRLKFEDEDTFLINCFNQYNQEVGYIRLEKIHCGSYYIFEDVLTYEEYDDFFPEDKFLYLRDLYVYKNFRHKGYGNILMSRFLETFNKPHKVYEDFNKYPVCLNASPFDEFHNNTLTLEYLIEFYKKFGFSIMKKQKNNCFMILEPISEISLIENIIRYQKNTQQSKSKFSFK
jgi:ribosomal protein S18 acetylase RimI-like enzyme